MFLGGYGWKSGKLLRAAGSRKHFNAGFSNNSQGIISIIDNFIHFKIAKKYTQEYRNYHVVNHKTLQKYRLIEKKTKKKTPIDRQLGRKK